MVSTAYPAYSTLSRVAAVVVAAENAWGKLLYVSASTAAAACTLRPTESCVERKNFCGAAAAESVDAVSVSAPAVSCADVARLSEPCRHEDSAPPPTVGAGASGDGSRGSTTECPRPADALGVSSAPVSSALALAAPSGPAAAAGSPIFTLALGEAAAASESGAPASCSCFSAPAAACCWSAAGPFC